MLYRRIKRAQRGGIRCWNGQKRMGKMRTKEIINSGIERAVNPYHALLLAMEIFDEDAEDGVPIQYTGDAGTVAMAFAMGNLTDRERDVMHLRYYRGMDYEGIGNLYGVTRERIRQVEHKALRKLRGRKNVRLLMTEGITAYWQREVETEARLRANDYQKKLDQEFTERVNAWEIANKATLPEERSEVTASDVELEAKLRMTIEQLDLSVRSYNCLKRARIDTVADLTHRSYEQMLCVRNLGRKSLEEVENKLKGLGFDFATESEKVVPEYSFTNEHGVKIYQCPVCHHGWHRWERQNCICGCVLKWTEVPA